MVQYWILVFNRVRRDKLDKGGLERALKRASLTTLCEQYRLDGALIAPALVHLELITDMAGEVPYSTLYYGAEGSRPIFIQRWDAKQDDGAIMLAAHLEKSHSEVLTGHFTETRQIWGISLLPAQLREMGLVLAYEVGRYLAVQGRGLVYGLDGVWYRLNRHEAFLPLQPSPQDVL